MTPEQAKATQQAVDSAFEAFKLPVPDVWESNSDAFWLAWDAAWKRLHEEHFRSAAPIFSTNSAHCTTQLKEFE